MDELQSSEETPKADPLKGAREAVEKLGYGVTQKNKATIVIALAPNQLRDALVIKAEMPPNVTVGHTKEGRLTGAAPKQALESLFVDLYQAGETSMGNLDPSIPKTQEAIEELGYEVKAVDRSGVVNIILPISADRQGRLGLLAVPSSDEKAMLVLNYTLSRAPLARSRSVDANKTLMNLFAQLYEDGQRSAKEGK